VHVLDLRLCHNIGGILKVDYVYILDRHKLSESQIDDINTIALATIALGTRAAPYIITIDLFLFD
jgi:hypothetical protein